MTPNRGITVRRAATWPFIGLIFAYRVTLGPFLGGHCRFHPTCSQYALEAYRAHGAIRGSWLTLRRLARCHPLGGSGFDPVPESRESGGETAGMNGDSGK